MFVQHEARDSEPTFFENLPGLILIVSGNTYSISAFYSWPVNRGTALISSTFGEYPIPSFHFLWDFFLPPIGEIQENPTFSDFHSLLLHTVGPAVTGSTAEQAASFRVVAGWVPSPSPWPTSGSQGPDLKGRKVGGTVLTSDVRRGLHSVLSDRKHN